MTMFQFGFAKENITPKRGVKLSGYFEPRPNIGAHDCLFVKAAVFECNGVKTGIVAYDLIGLPRTVCDFFMDELQKAGIDFAGNLVFSAIHTHTAPYISMDFSPESPVDEDYIRSLAAKTVSAVKIANESLAEAQMLTGKAVCHNLAFNRRFWMKDGGVLTNPGKLNPGIVGPEGEIDPDIPFFIIRQDGMDKLIVTNISNHTDTIGDEMVSADWPGRMERAIQDHYGYDIPVMTILGCQGNINHFNVKTAFDQTNYAEACRIGKGYAAAVISMLYSALPVEIDSISAVAEEIECPPVQITDEEYNAAKKVVDELEGVVASEAKDLTSEGLAAGNPYVLRYFAKRITDCRENPMTEKRIERMVALKFGKALCIQTLPCEPFVELGFAIKAASTFPCTIIAAVANGYMGYLGMPDCYERGGGYETRPSRTAPAHDLAPKLIALGIKLING